MTTREILQKYRKIAVVGLSSDLSRASHGVSQYMQNAGYEITPVNPNEIEVLGRKAYASLDDVPGPIEIVDVFRRSEFVPDVVEAAIRRHAKVVWLQLGVRHDAAAKHARDAGIEVLVDNCILQEHMKIFGFGRNVFEA
jgi:predicted CoA-binding protein